MVYLRHDDSPQASDQPGMHSLLSLHLALCPAGLSVWQGQLLWQDYLTLVEWSGREWRPGKRGRIDPDLPFILERLETDQETWLKDLRRMNSWHGRALGSLEALQAYCEHLGQRWMLGLQHHINLTEPAATPS